MNQSPIVQPASSAAPCYAALDDLTKEQKSLLLFLETRAVDHGGLVATEHMNDDDLAQAKSWTTAGFIGFGRLASESMTHPRRSTHWVTLSDEAWKWTHAERRARNGRLYEKRTWLKTSELRQAA
jgi:hypothetical protein